VNASHANARSIGFGKGWPWRPLEWFDPSFIGPPRPNPRQGSATKFGPDGQ